VSILRCKGVHVKLDRSTHAGFKTRLLHHDLTMQGAFEEFAKQVAEGVPSAIRILERMASNKIKADLAEVGLTRKGSKRRSGPLDELDHESLYDLINESDNDEETPRAKGHDETV